MESKILATRDNKGKIRIASLSADTREDDAGEYYVINRATGLYGGKQTPGPAIEIHKGKAKRTTKEQAELQYNALLKEYKDKGYIEVDTTANLEDQVPSCKQDQHFAVKPMLCKVIDFTDKKLLGKTWWASVKHDGTRSTMFLRDGKIVTASRGGTDYDLATTYIRQDPTIRQIFKEHPDIILDGEIYRHGWPLNIISGLCRLETLDERHKELCFHCYDIVDETKTFEERLKVLESLPSSSKLVIVPHLKIEANKTLEDFQKQVMTFHDGAIKMGYEGAVVRDGAEKYKCGGRDRRMQKIKLFEDHEYKIVDIVEGLRDEDMCFLMEMEDGKQFKAKPMGTREDKDNYRKNIDKMRGKMATVKHFGYGTNGVPNLPV